MAEAPKKQEFRRLPKTVIPKHYELELKPDLVGFKFTGRLLVNVEFIALSALVALASAVPYKSNNYQYSSQNSGHVSNNYQNQDYHQQQSYKQIPIVRYEADQGRDGYHYGYEAGNGISAAEQGQVKNAGQKDAAISAQGHFSFVGTDGKNYAVQYQADENGFRATGNHLPTPPPVPAEIQKSLGQSQYSGQSQQYHGNNNQKW